MGIYKRLYVFSGFIAFTSAVRYFTFCVPVLLVGPRYMRGEAEFGQIAQTQFAFSMIFESLMLIMNKLPQMANLGVHVTRLHSMQQVLEREASSALIPQGARGRGSITLEQGHTNPTVVLDVCCVTLRTP